MENHYKKEIACLLKDFVTLSEKEIINLIEIPPKKEMGDLAFPCFTLAKSFKKAPKQIAEQISAQLKPSKLFSNIQAIGPYVNFYYNKLQFIKSTLKEVLNWTRKDFISTGQGKTVVIDFSSPNIAKPFSIAHLRSTSIGNSLSHIFEYIGYRVVRINHLGDWGTSFGKLIVAYKLWGRDDKLKKSPIKTLLELYVQFHKAAEENPKLEEDARAWFKKLETGDDDAVKLWSWFKELSLEEFNRMYSLIGVRFDYYWGESFYQSRIDSTIEVLKAKKLLTESQGALIVDLEKYDMPPLLLKKQDGATLYATRDITAAIYRMEQFYFDEMIYVVGGEQDLHFKQFFKVLELVGYSWADRCDHVNFGLIQFKDGKMSTREGKIIFLEEVIEKAKDLALEKINETDSEKPIEDRLSNEEKEERALKTGISSVIFSDLKNGRQKDVLFDWGEMLNPKGETGIYLQYAHARLCGILRKFETRIGTIDKSLSNITEEASFDIAKTLSSFMEQLIHAAKTREPSVIARYLLDLGQTFSTYYRVNHVINENNHNLSKERVLTVLAVKKVLADGLKLLGIEPLERM